MWSAVLYVWFIRNWIRVVCSFGWCVRVCILYMCCTHLTHIWHKNQTTSWMHIQTHIYIYFIYMRSCFVSIRALLPLFPHPSQLFRHAKLSIFAFKYKHDKLSTLGDNLNWLSTLGNILVQVFVCLSVHWWCIWIGKLKNSFVKRTATKKTQMLSKQQKRSKHQKFYRNGIRIVKKEKKKSGSGGGDDGGLFT